MKTSVLFGTAVAVAGVIVLGQARTDAVAGVNAKRHDLGKSAPAQAQETGAIGPDVIVGAIPDVRWWASDGVETAYSIATTSCNVGDENLNWIDTPSNLHPVIGQNLYRMSADGSKFEQIGQSWLKHGFCALQLDLAGCGNCPNSPGCLQHLEPGCSDPYSASRNGGQSGLGPKWQVNAHTGVFPIPWDQGEGTAGDFRRRLRVANSDLNQGMNPDTRFFVEAQYVTQDDAAAGNQNNNASYRECDIDVNDDYDMSLMGSTHMMEPALNAWQAAYPDVEITEVLVPGEGKFIVACKVTQRTPTSWQYEYAVYNMNSDRSAGSFMVPVPASVNTNGLTFHDVDYHSGEPWDGTDWDKVRNATDVTWNTEDYNSNNNANAIRWGTMYNFRFFANSPATTGTATIGLFKTGSPSSLTVDVKVPMEIIVDCPEDIDGSGSIDFGDLLAVLSNWACTTCPDEDLDDSGTVDFGDLLQILSNWGPCP